MLFTCFSDESAGDDGGLKKLTKSEDSSLVLDGGLPLVSAFA
jgi:hypothetical protein